MTESEASAVQPTIRTTFESVKGSLILVVLIFSVACSSEDIVQSETREHGTDMSAADSGVDLTVPPDDMILGDQNFSTEDMDSMMDMSSMADVAREPRVAPSGVDVRTLEDDELVECKCPLEQDACTTRGKCARKGTFCSPFEDTCPEGYTCSSDGLCECFGREDRCKPRCQFDEECPFISGCLASGICGATNRRCDNALHCPIGQVCHSITLGPNREREICDTPGPVPAGDDCETGYECASGRCVDDVCATPCVRNGDCPDDVGCNQYRGVCEGERRGNCGDDAVVWRFDLCVSQFCSHSADCGPQTDCVMTGAGNELGYCLEESSENPCKPGEVAISPLPLPRFPDLCWSMSKQGCTPGSCNEPYYCFGDHNYRDIRAQCVRER